MASTKSKVSEPIRAQSPSVIEWSKTLRSRSPSPTRASSRTLSRSHSPSSSQVKTTKSILRTQSSSPNRLAFSTSDLEDLKVTPSKRFPSSSSVRKSTSSWASRVNSGVSFSGKSSRSICNNDLADLEASYIKNLQQQIYFLELESNYLREQANKATDLHPKMTIEAEKMLSKLRQLQMEMSDMQIEMRRKDTNLCVTQAEKERTQEILLLQEESRHRDKLVMTDEIITLKKIKDRLEMEAIRRDKQLLEAKTEVDKSTTALRSAEMKITCLKNQLDQRTEQHQLTQLALEEKRSAVLSLEAQLRDVEDRYYNNTVVVHDKVTQDLRDEIAFLRQKLQDLEQSAEKDRFMKEKLSDENTSLSREKTCTSFRVSELQKQLDRERSLLEKTEQRQRENIVEMVSLRESEKQLKMQLEQQQVQLQREQEKAQSYLEQLTKQEKLSGSVEIQLNSTKLNLSETESLHQAAESENNQLRKDKMLLVDHVADLQRQIEIKDREIMTLQSEVSSLDARMQDLDYQKNLESTVHSQKWHEFGRLAESMRSLSTTMARSASPTQSQSKILQY
ncbi:golgin subfamily A member 6-like protein 22 isoform X2 [Patella vulgata]|nr:golgin subfamily A member 6-like protein 22 isoform X2 [Patella vulgata]